MRKKNYKGRCMKRDVNKCVDICRTYDPIQTAYADILASDDENIGIQLQRSNGWIIRWSVYV